MIYKNNFGLQKYGSMNGKFLFLRSELFPFPIFVHNLDEEDNFVCQHDLVVIHHFLKGSEDLVFVKLVVHMLFVYVFGHLSDGHRLGTLALEEVEE